MVPTVFKSESPTRTWTWAVGFIVQCRNHHTTAAHECHEDWTVDTLQRSDYKANSSFQEHLRTIPLGRLFPLELKLPRIVWKYERLTARRWMGRVQEDAVVSEFIKIDRWFRNLFLHQIRSVTSDWVCLIHQTCYVLIFSEKCTPPLLSPN